MSNVKAECSELELKRAYLLAKEQLEVNLKLYRLAVINNIESEIPIISKRVERCQVTLERLYFLRCHEHDNK